MGQWCKNKFKDCQQQKNKDAVHYNFSICYDVWFHWNGKNAQSLCFFTSVTVQFDDDDDEKVFTIEGNWLFLSKWYVLSGSLLKIIELL